MKHRVQHELELGTPCPQHCVEPRIDLREGVLRLGFHRPHRHHQPTGQRDGEGRHHGGKRVLPEALQDDSEQRHGVTSGARTA